MKDIEERLLRIFYRLLDAFGKRYWWPGDTPLEIIVGAVLTQNTTWKNVEKAINNLKKEDMLSFEALYGVDEKRLSDIIKPAGYYNIKSNRLKNTIKLFYEEYNSSIDYLSTISTEKLRKSLLGVKGIGKETADSILLYALNRPVFVVDTYTKRFLKNHRPPLMDDSWGIKDKDSYDYIQGFFTRHLPLDKYIYNEYHALIVCLGQRYCKKIPDCGGCPLKGI
ncbi:MAG TPA: hypothetical protein PLR38_02695 [Syntrophorhabdaceae bacterium]|nr:hypothetical protein [Syntrophorhabdaceae bacterium]HOL05006.1 hypothetical protein [Syntrophorhabdaceae bacterium]HPP41230.1 hypothetical protein [Syntrophorhabdaceae bacterium]